MKEVFNFDNPVMQLLSKAGNLLIVNLLWMLCSIPILTIGASTTALYYVCFKMMSEEDIPVCRSFFREFKKNLKQASILWITLLVVAAIILLDIYWLVRASLIRTVGGLILFCISLFIGIILVAVFIYGFALQSYFENTLKHTVKNAIILGITNYLYTLFMGVFDVVITAVGVIYCPFIVPVVPIFLNSVILQKVFSKYSTGNDTNTVQE